MNKIAQAFLDEVISDLEQKRLVLPTLPEVALRVRDAVEDENASIGAIVKIISSDAALSARLIQVANSPLMRASRPIETLEAAVTRMGMKLVRDLATSMVMQQMFQATNDITDRRLRQIWEHHTEVASIAHVLAAQFTKLRPEQAMLAGLVHDIGTLPILTKAEDHPEVLENEAILDEVLRETHTKVGEAILTAWNFPPEMIKVAAEHENIYRDSPTVEYVDIVIVANLQSRVGQNHPLGNVDWSQVPAFAKLGLSAEVSVIEMEETAEEIREAQRLLK